MKRYGDLHDQVTSWENLVLVARKARRGKRARQEVRAFNFDQEARLLRLGEELRDGTYTPGAFRTHRITRPKPRLISAAPYRDRVVHHALMNVLEPILDRHMHPDSYACRRGKGTHAAVDRLQTLMRRNTHVLQCDIRQFFPSIDHQIMKGVFRRLVKDTRTLELMDRIVDAGAAPNPTSDWFAGDDLFTPAARARGLPIGNLTSQWFSNWLLCGLDHTLSSRLGFGSYVRYCDDFLVLSNDRAALSRARGFIREHLEGLRLRLHEGKLAIRPAHAGVTFLGFRAWPSHRLLRKPAIRAMRRRVRWMRSESRAGRIGYDHIKPRLVAWLGHARQADSRQLITRLSKEWAFVRDGIDKGACSARRLLEQQLPELPLCQPEQQLARQPEHQQRLPCCPALAIAGASARAMGPESFGPRARGARPRES